LLCFGNYTVAYIERIMQIKENGYTLATVSIIVQLFKPTIKLVNLNCARTKSKEKGESN
jgi:hypothetical protein